MTFRQHSKENKGSIEHILSNAKVSLMQTTKSEWFKRNSAHGAIGPPARINALPKNCHIRHVEDTMFVELCHKYAGRLIAEIETL